MDDADLDVDLVLVWDDDDYEWDPDDEYWDFDYEILEDDLL